ncbi:WD40 repeat-like protein [Pseudovirgaria hyperparasitica]|uniref:WD40 repeat-like protein n=1 Tax=Pseudovirgaria hyperparasitica TaxID=470096 RepID=A0A6A6VUE8_9PEZI|nr:WD40 repeat-like protein [Pseudovirgaria hyperparasitica]KAF2753843.1 WD40 repeat-like protein [Pseudovirgaria hyperparasitica]
MNFVTFNQDRTLLGVGTTKGFRLYSTEPFSKCFETEEGDIALLEMLFSTSLVAISLSPRLLRIQNTKRHSTICELTFPSRILAVRMNRKRLVVVMEGTIHLYDISNMTHLGALDTSPNPNAICALSPSSDNNYLVYPLPQKASSSAYTPPSHAPPSQGHVTPSSGEVLIYDATRKEAVNVIQAHQTPLSCVALNNEGSLLATASEKGTIIRVFSVPDAQKLFQFRRGSMPSTIQSMSLNSTSTLLCVSSASDTVHIFRLSAAARHTRGSSITSISDLTKSSVDGRSSSPSSEETRYNSLMDASGVDTTHDRKALNPTFASMIRRTSQNVGKTFAATVGGYLPSAVAEIWEPSRDFAWVKIPRSQNPSNTGPVRSVVALSNNGPQVMVVTSEGNYYVFNIDLEKGGEGTLVKSHSIIGSSDILGRSMLDD